jgi:cytochrome P450
MASPPAFPPAPQVPSVAGKPGSDAVAMGESALAFLLGLIREQGDAAQYRTPFGTVHFFNHPDHVQAVLQGGQFARTSLSSAILGQGLLASEGNLWRKQRRLLQPPFHERRLGEMVPAMLGALERMRERWAAAPGEGEIDLAAEMRRLALDAILRAFFSEQAEENAEEICRAVGMTIEDLGRIASTCFQQRERFAPGRNADFQLAKTVLDEFVGRLVEKRRLRKNGPPDLLSLLLEARDEETGAPLPDRQVHDEVVTMLIAGHETTALTLGWCWLMLERHPDAEARMHREVDEVLGGRLPGLEDISRLVYTRMVIEETMRLYPPVWSMMRTATAPAELAGRHLPAGSLVLICPYTTHRHPDFWEEPARFDPERFTPERNFARHRYAYVPFSAGRHHCLGAGFAMLELPLLLAGIAQRFRLRFVPGAKVEPVVSLTLRQPEGFRATIGKRS